MDDVRAVYNSDQSSRSNLVKSAMHRKNGPAVPKLGNRQMTNLEIMERHSSVIEYPSLKEFMDYSDFVKLADDLKIKYVLMLCDKYDISIKEISRFLFNKGDDGLRAHLRNCKMKKDDSVVTVLSQCCPNKQRGKTGLQQFRDDIKEWEFGNKLNKDIKSGEKKKEIKFMDRDTFCLSPLDYQINFINMIIERYQVTCKFISSVLFETYSSWLSAHFTKLKVNEKITKLPRVLVANKDIMELNERKFQHDVGIWRGVPEKKEEDSAEIIHRNKIGEGGFGMDKPPVPTIEKKVKLIPCRECFYSREINGKLFCEVYRNGTGSMVSSCSHAIPKDTAIKAETVLAEIAGVPADTPVEEITQKIIFEDNNEETEKIEVHNDPELMNASEPAKETGSEIPEMKYPEYDPMEYHEFHVTVSGVSYGLNRSEFDALANIIGNKRVKYELTVTEV